MSIFKNKHVIMAMIMAPVLAIASYYLVDLAVKEQPQKAVEGHTYKLIPQSNCRFSSGLCDLENGTFKSTVRIVTENDRQRLRLSSANQLQTVSIGFVTSDGTESGPYKLRPNNDTGTQWTTEFTELADASTLLRVALSANDAHYYSETTMGFSDYQTSFSEDFRKQN